MVSRFIEIVQQDQDRVFNNPKEFAITVSWNGKPLVIVEHADIEKNEYETQGMSQLWKKVICSNLDLVPMPISAEEVNLDGEMWQIVDVEPYPERYEILMRRVD